MQNDRPLTILILGLNYAPEMIGIAVYTQGLAESLANLGNDVHVIAGRPYYPSWRVFNGFRGWGVRRRTEGGVDVTRLIHYVPKNPTGFRRILHHLTFAASSFIPTIVRALRIRPDIVMTIAPSLISAPVGWLAARCVGARCWLHVQDFEVEAAMATNLVSSSGFVPTLAKSFESWVLMRFDRISSISPAMCRKLAQKGVQADRIFELRNWSALEVIAPLEANSKYRTEWNITAPYVALYSGNIANKQGIEIIVDVARRLAHREDLVFIICGDGPNRSALEALGHGLQNVQFHDLQPIERLGELLGLATVHLLVQRSGTADLVLPSKMANMLASGRAILATSPKDSDLAAEVEGCGLLVPPDDAEALAATLEQLLDNPRMREQFGEAGRQRAESRWKRSSLIGAANSALVEMCGANAVRTQGIEEARTTSSRT